APGKAASATSGRNSVWVRARAGPPGGRSRCRRAGYRSDHAMRMQPGHAATGWDRGLAGVDRIDGYSAIGGP
ncbi:MAG: hypothetical protein OXN89_02595, partial [Bryobacterales bacterium]|nr:hypothetical protein [Bryobacterales bacterium]